MGDPRKSRKTFQTPMHPWEKERIVLEKQLIAEYGLKNKKEIMKMQSILKNFKDQAKTYIAATGKQADHEKKQMMNKIIRLGFIGKTATLDDVLSLDIRSILDRRLQTIVYKLKLCQSIRQARQFIVHRHITIGGEKITTPSYIVSNEEEKKIAFVASSSLSDGDHPERQIKTPKEVKETKADKKDGKTTRKRKTEK